MIFQAILLYKPTSNRGTAFDLSHLGPKSYKARARRALSRTATVIVVVVIIVIIASAGIYALMRSTSSTSFTSSPTSAATTSLPTSTITSSLTSSFTSLTSSAMTTSSSSFSTSSLTSSLTSSSRTSSSTSEGGVFDNNTFTVDIGSWPLGSLNQLLAPGAGIYPDLPAYASWQTLVAVNLTADYPGSVIQYLPDLATNWTVSASGTIYTFNLRQNVTFSNGDPFNAYQVWTVYYGFYYLSDNSTAWYNGYPLFNMAPVNFGPASISLLQQSGLINPNSQALAMMSNSSWPIYAPNQNTIVFQITHPFQWFLGTLQALLACIYDAQYLLQNGAFGTPTSLNTYFNTNAIPGTGPYMVTSVSNLQYVGFTQNPTYWGKNLPESTIVSNPVIDPGHVKNILVKVVSSPTSEYIDLSSGTAQMTDPLGGAVFSLILANPEKFGYVTMPPASGEMALESFNTQIYPTNITDVRLAIVHAINMTNLISDSYGPGSYTQIVGPEYPAWSQFYDLGNYTPYSYNLTLANQYLTAAGFPNGKGLPSLNWTLASNCALCIERASIAQADLAQIGINVVIQEVTFDQWCDLICNPYSYLINNTNTISNIMDPEGQDAQPEFLSPVEYWTAFVTNNSAFSNTAIYSTPITDACAASFFNGSSVATIQSICAQAQKQVYDDAPYWGWGICKYLFGDSSPAWDKDVVQNGYMDPLYGGISTIPILNTITFTS